MNASAPQFPPQYNNPQQGGYSSNIQDVSYPQGYPTPPQLLVQNAPMPLQGAAYPQGYSVSQPLQGAAYPQAYPTSVPSQGYPTQPQSAFQSGPLPPPPPGFTVNPEYSMSGNYPANFPTGQNYYYNTGYSTGVQPPNIESSANFTSDNIKYGGTDDPNTSVNGWEGFSDKAIRRAFIRKVYAILMLQLAFTTGVIALFIYEPRVKRVVRTHRYLYIIAYVAFIVLYFTLFCCSNLRRKWPSNLILLSLFTLALSYMVGTTSSFYNTDVVLLAAGICAACCLAITLFSFNTKIDLTSCGGVLCILGFVLLLFGILTIFTYNRIMITIYASFGALLFMLYLAYDTQRMMSGKKHQISAEEHIFASLQLYLDIINIFLYLLCLLSSLRSAD